MATRFGKYFVDERIAVGGMAEIFRGHTSSDQYVALKKVLPIYASQPKFVQMFLDEASIVSRLRHPNIVQLLDFGRIGETYFFSMEWIDGMPLSAVVRPQVEQQVLFPIEVALLIVIDIAEGLHYAHSRIDQYGRSLGIVHRDVSPPNIMLTRDSVAKLTDFGIAEARDKGIQTKPGIIRGKFSYMSPEQSRGDVIDARSDVFSLAIVLYELLSSTRLFLREQEVETIRAVRKGKYLPLSTYRNDVSNDVMKAVAKGLALTPEKRFESAGEMAERLREIFASEFPGAGRERIATFLSQLFPGQPFRPVAKPGQPPFRPTVRTTPVSWRDRLLAHRYLVTLGLGLGAIILAELIARFW